MIAADDSKTHPFCPDRFRDNPTVPKEDERRSPMSVDLRWYLEARFLWKTMVAFSPPHPWFARVAFRNFSVWTSDRAACVALSRFRLGLTSVEQFRPPFGGLLGLAPILVEADYPLASL